MKFPFFGRKKRPRPITISDKDENKRRGDIAVILTALGKKKADAYTLRGPRYVIVSSLSENGPMTLNELTEDTHMETKKVRDICKSLMRAGFIKKVIA